MDTNDAKFKLVIRLLQFVGQERNILSTDYLWALQKCPGAWATLYFKARLKVRDRSNWIDISQS